MIYEIRTYGLIPGSLPEVEKRFGEAYEYRKKYSELIAFWHTDIGPLNEIIHIWPYEDMSERARVRAEASKDFNWPPKISEFIHTMNSEILIPFPCSPELIPGKYGPIYEMRIYTLKSGMLRDAMRVWEQKLPERMKLSPCVLVGHVDLGVANRMIHIWSHNDLNERATIRVQAVERGLWPPDGMAARLHTMMNKIVLPAPFSPMQ